MSPTWVSATRHCFEPAAAQDYSSVAVVIPALNEQDAIGCVLDDQPPWLLKYNTFHGFFARFR